MPKIDQSKNAYPLSLRFKYACLGLVDGKISNQQREEIKLDISLIRKKIGAVDWDNFDPTSKEAHDVFPFLVAIAEHTKAGLDLLIDVYKFDQNLRHRYAQGVVPSRFITKSLTPSLKEIVEAQLEAFEKALEDNREFEGYDESYPVPIPLTIAAGTLPIAYPKRQR